MSTYRLGRRVGASRPPRPQPHRPKPPWRRLLVTSSTVVALSLPSGSIAAATCWDPPLIAPVSDPYREPPCRWCPGNRGIEFDSAPGHIVRAVASGRVTFAGAVAGIGYVVIDHGDGFRATYGRLVDVLHQTGDLVIRGSIVGHAGDRFHFGLRDGDRYVDPTPYLGRRVYRVRLVPTDGTPGRMVPPALVCGSVS